MYASKSQLLRFHQHLPPPVTVKGLCPNRVTRLYCTRLLWFADCYHRKTLGPVQSAHGTVSREV